MMHDLKTWPEYFQAVKSGAKPFEVRHEHDRAFSVGDVLCFREWEPDAEAYTGDSIERVVTYVLRDAFWLGLRPNFAVLGLAAVQDERSGAR